MPSLALTTASQTLYDPDNVTADKVTGRVKSYYVYVASSATDVVDVLINNETTTRTLPAGGAMVFTAAGKIYKVQAKLPDASAGAATIHYGIAAIS
jgi:hypothetical protein